MIDAWGERYGGSDYFYGTEPNDFLRENCHRFRPGGQILCLGEGEGRNAVFLAGQGFVVTAVDGSRVGLDKLAHLAKARQVEVKAKVCDLNDYDLGYTAWDGIVSIWCHLPSTLRKKVHFGSVRALKSGGLFLLEAYTPRQLEFGTGGPKDVDLLLTLESVLADFAQLKTECAMETERDVQEGRGHCGRSAVVRYIGRAS